jgi:hypothetical protein
MSTYVELADASLNIAFLSLHRRRGAIRTGLDFAFEFYFDTLSSTHTSVTSQKTLTLSSFEVKIYYTGNNNRELYLGTLIPGKPTISLQANIKTNIVFKLDLTFSELRQLEELKEQTNIQFLTIFIFSSGTETQAQSKTMHKTQLGFNVSKSDWAESFLSRMRFFRRPIFTF